MITIHLVQNFCMQVPKCITNDVIMHYTYDAAMPEDLRSIRLLFSFHSLSHLQENKPRIEVAERTNPPEETLTHLLAPLLHSQMADLIWYLNDGTTQPNFAEHSLGA